MNQRFAALVAPLEAKCQALLAMAPVAAADVPSGTPVGGVYLFSEGDVHLYAGRTKRPIRERIRNQFGSNPSAASFPCSWHVRQQAGRPPTAGRGRVASCSRTRSSGRSTRARGPGYVGCTCDTCTSPSRCGRRCWRSTSPSSPAHVTTTSTRTDHGRPPQDCGIAASRPAPNPRRVSQRHRRDRTPLLPPAGSSAPARTMARPAPSKRDACRRR